MVFGNDSPKTVQEIASFLNANNYTATFDTFIDVLRNKELPKSFDLVKLVSSLTPESKLRFVDIVNNDSNNLTLKTVF
jgi:hypothetical protein